MSLFILLPTYSILAVLASLFALKTPFNRVMYAVLPFFVIYGLIKGFLHIRKKNVDLHMDMMFFAFMVLSAAPIYREIMFFLWLFTHKNQWTNNMYPFDGGAILTYMFLISCFIITFTVNNRMRDHLRPIIFFTMVLVCSLIFLPWEFFGAPTLQTFLLKKYV